MNVLETERTILREMIADDAEFILDLLNQPSFIKYIGDRNVRTVEQARDYIETRFTASYGKFGYGLWLVKLRETGAAIGICGFVKRDFLPDADIGFALLPEFEKQGYAFETARASLDYGRKRLDFKKILAITSPENVNSEKLLEKLGFKYENLIEQPGENKKLKLFSSEA